MVSKKEFIEVTKGVWRISSEHRFRDIVKAPFPERLVYYCLGVLSFKEALVLDPFMGGGTTGVVAKSLV